MEELVVEETPIPGLLVLRLPMHEDGRGWFKENWQRQKMVARGMPDFGPVQNNVSFNERAGATRGIHAEPWDKLVSLATGRIFGAWVDLRPGPAFATVFTLEIGPQTAVFVPRGVGNAFQTLVDETAYVYLANDHWSADLRDSYTFVNLADPELGIDWPLPLETAELSDADRAHPMLSEVLPARPRRTLVLGAGGQLANAFAAALPDAEYLSRAELDLVDPNAIDSLAWGEYDVVINAAAYTAVDLAETAEGRREAWAVNSAAVARLAARARDSGSVLVHFSSDYVFDGTLEVHTELEEPSPLGVYGQSKAAGDIAASMAPKHYVLRTSWVVGDGPNFVRKMVELADSGGCPDVVADQRGRLTFTEDVVKATLHLLQSRSEYGTYNVSCAGPIQAWDEIAREVFALRQRSASDVHSVTTAEYESGRRRALAPRPRNSALDLSKLEATGFFPRDGEEALRAYVLGMSSQS